MSEIEGKKVSKSALVREYKKANKAAKPQEIAEALVVQGVPVTAAFVSTILSAAKRKKAAKRQARQVGDGDTAVRAKSNGAATSVAVKSPGASGSVVHDDYAVLIQAKQLATQLGGIEKARAALDALSQILA